MDIHFFTEDVSYSLEHTHTIRSWLVHVAELHHFQIHSLNYVFCSDQYLLEINKAYLNHDYFTDIITFDHSESINQIEGDIFISIDRVKDNSQKLGTDFQQELYRVIIHGLLHLLGYPDKTESEKKRMREKEEACLSLLKTQSST